MFNSNSKTNDKCKCIMLREPPKFRLDKPPILPPNLQLDLLYLQPSNQTNQFIRFKNSNELNSYLKCSSSMINKTRIDYFTSTSIDKLTLINKNDYITSSSATLYTNNPNLFITNSSVFLLNDFNSSLYIRFF